MDSSKTGIRRGVVRVSCTLAKRGFSKRFTHEAPRRERTMIVSKAQIPIAAMELSSRPSTSSKIDSSRELRVRR